MGGPTPQLVWKVDSGFFSPEGLRTFVAHTFPKFSGVYPRDFTLLGETLNACFQNDDFGTYILGIDV